MSSTYKGPRTKAAEGTDRKVVPLQDWEERGECFGQEVNDLFFPKESGIPEEAAAMCKRCKVRKECHDWAVATKQRYGIWGGVNMDKYKQ